VFAYPTEASWSADVKTGEIAGKEPGVPSHRTNSRFLRFGNAKSMGGKGERKPWGTTEPKVNGSSPFECNLNSRMDLVPVPAAVFLRPQGEAWRYSRFLEGIQIRCWLVAR
jgi:hypothetical protein